MGKRRNKNKTKNKDKASLLSSATTPSTDAAVVSEADAAAGVISPKETTTVEPLDTTKTKADDTTPPTTTPTTTTSSKRARDVYHDNAPTPLEKLTRKQKRQKLNEKNKWPQHPKIVNSQARERAYLRVAGIEAVSEDQQDATDFPVILAAAAATKETTTSHQNQTKTKQKAQSSIDKNNNIKTLVVEEEDDQEWRRFGRFLGGTDARTRHRAVKRLGLYLKAKAGFGVTDADLEQVEGLSELDWMKLWKGLWFTLYMADKVPVQDELSKHLAKLIWCVAGSVEEDVFAGEAYMAMHEQEESELEHEHDENCHHNEEDEEDDADDDDEEEDVQILSSRFVEADADDDEEQEQEQEGSDTKDRDDSDDDEDGHKDMDVEEEEEDEDEDEDEEDEEADEDAKHIRGAPLAMLMIRTFFRTLLREWGNMDKYRIDKFYTLIRYVLREVYRYMATRQWNLGIIRLFNDAITEEALINPPNGIRYHLTDIALEELNMIVNNNSNSNSSNKSQQQPLLPLTEAIFLEVMEPFFEMAQHGFGDKTVQARAMEKVLQRFLLEYSVVSDHNNNNNNGDDNDDKDNNKKNNFDQIHVGTVSKYIFEMASAETTLDIHRKSLYEMHKTYERQLKKVGKDVDIENDNDEDEDEDDADYDEAMEEGEEGEDDDLEAMGFVPEEEKNDDDNEKSESSSDQEEPPSQKSKKKKNNEEKQHSQNAVPDESVTRESPGNNKNRMKSKDKSSPQDQMDLTQHGDESAKKRRKRKKRRKNSLDKQDDEGKGNDDVVTISLKEQKNAKKSLEKEREASAVDRKEDDNNLKTNNQKKKKEAKGERKAPKRRVSFGDKNTARSWKASMQGLRTLDPATVITSKTPEKSILLNKGKKSPVNKGIATQRRRAVDYF